MEAKKDFYFYLDEKCTIWTRTHFCVEADTYEEAQKRSLELVENGKCGNDYAGRSFGQCYNGASDYETLYETMEGITPSENGNNPTFELYNNEHELIKHNGSN
jgi:hypothetical protein